METVEKGGEPLMKQRPETAGHLAALFTVLIWGTTFISTKVLLTAFAPVEILFSAFFNRFELGRSL